MPQTPPLFTIIYFRYQLSEDDPNYQTYAEGAEDTTQPIKYYVNQAEKLKADEKVNLFVDYSHLINFRFKDDNFLRLIINEYHRFEPYLRLAIT